MDNGNTAALLGGVEFSIMHIVDNRIGVRGGFQYASRRLFLTSDAVSLHGLGINLAVLGKITGSHSRSQDYIVFRAPGASSGSLLGAELQFEYLWGSNLDRGVFSLPFTFEYWAMAGD